MKNKDYHSVGTFPKSNRKMVQRGKIYERMMKYVLY